MHSWTRTAHPGTRLVHVGNRTIGRTGGTITLRVVTHLHLLQLRERGGRVDGARGTSHGRVLHSSCVRMTGRNAAGISTLRTGGIHHRCRWHRTADGTRRARRGHDFLFDGDARGGTHRSGAHGGGVTRGVLLRVGTRHVRIATGIHVWRHPGARRPVGAVEGRIGAGHGSVGAAGGGRRGAGKGRGSIDGISRGSGRRIGGTWRSVGLRKWARISQ